jgi:hypothetical protein
MAIGPGVALFSLRLQAQKPSPPAQTALVQTLVPLHKLTSVGNTWAGDVFWQQHHDVNESTEYLCQLLSWNRNFSSFNTTDVLCRLCYFVRAASSTLVHI